MEIHEIHSRLSELDLLESEIKRAPVPLEIASKRIDSTVEKLSARFHKNMSFGGFLRDGHQSGDIREMFSRVGPAETFAAIDPKGMKAMILSKAKEAAKSMPEAMPDDVRKAELAKLAAERADLVKLEVTELWAIQDEFGDAPWRADLPPEEVLGLTGDAVIDDPRSLKIRVNDTNIPSSPPSPEPQF